MAEKLQIVGAGRGGRTPMTLRSADFESAASASSAIPACRSGSKYLSLKVVARDGIEPPTPAFSGPRSTTELSGLSANYALQFPARIPASPERVGNPETVGCNNL